MCEAQANHVSTWRLGSILYVVRANKHFGLVIVARPRNIKQPRFPFGTLQRTCLSCKLKVERQHMPQVHVPPSCAHVFHVGVVGVLPGIHGKLCSTSHGLPCFTNPCNLSRDYIEKQGAASYGKGARPMTGARPQATNQAMTPVEFDKLCYAIDCPLLSELRTHGADN